MKQSSLGVPVYTEEEIKAIQTYAIESPSSNKTAETGVYRSALSPNELLTTYANHKTVVDLFEMGVALNPNGPCLGYRTAVYDPQTGQVAKWNSFSWQTYRQVAQRRLDFGRGLQYVHDVLLELQPMEKWHLGIYSTNRPEWAIADMGALLFSNATVALYDTLGPETSEFIINHADIPIIVTSLDKVLNLIKLLPKCPKLKAIIVMDDNFPSISSTMIAPLKLFQQWASEKGVSVYRFSAIEEFGKKHQIPPRLPKADDLFCICYTSGTTGNPKGALLSHANMVAVQRAIDLQFEILVNDVHISYLPLAHVFERAVFSCIMTKGASAGFFRGDVAFLIEDIQLLRPTVFPSVPRLLNRIYDKITNQVLASGGVKKFLFDKALKTKLDNLEHHKQLKHALWDRLVFSKIQSVLGGRVRCIITASAPISPSTLGFLRVVFGCEVVEAYGQTECCGGFTMTLPGDYSKGHVGSVLTCSELKLVSVPEMKYLAENKRGEIWARGGNVFKGYYKDEAKTAETITPDGWLKTGDIGSIDAKGKLSIIDRKKNIFKLSQGEYVAPDKIENTYVKSNFIAQVYVHGDSLQSELVAIVVPDPEFCVQWGKEKGFLSADTPPGINPPPPGQPPHPGLVSLSLLKEFKQTVLDDMNRLAKEDGLRGFEYVKSIYVEPNFFTIERGLLTPTFKTKRNEAADCYRPVIDEMYKQLNEKTVNASKL